MFYDWITIEQVHLLKDQILPIVATKVKHQTDFDTGELDYSVYTGVKHEGSFSSSCRITCDGCKVTFDGNISRFGRRDNLYGYTSIDDAVSAINKILSGYDLPPFTEGEFVGRLKLPDMPSKQTKVYTGAVFKRLDLTQNFETSYKKSDTVLRGLSSVSISGRPGFLYPNGKTVQWYLNEDGTGSRRKSLKAYCKAHDLMIHSDKDMDDLTLEYRDRLREYCVNYGVVRLELGMRTEELKSHDLRHFGQFDDDDCNRIYLKHRDMILGGVVISVHSYEAVESTLIELGCTEFIARDCQTIIDSWLGGHDMKQRLKRTRFYDRRRILKTIGIDIGVRHDVTRSPIKMRVIDIKAASLPDWYQHIA